MPPSPPTASPYSRVGLTQDLWTLIRFNKNQSVSKRITNLMRKVSHFTLRVYDLWFPISGIRPNPNFFSPRLGSTLRGEMVEILPGAENSHGARDGVLLRSPPPPWPCVAVCVCRPLLSWLFKGWLWIIPPGYETEWVLAIEQGGRARVGRSLLIRGRWKSLICGMQERWYRRRNNGRLHSCLNAA